MFLTISLVSIAAVGVVLELLRRTIRPRNTRSRRSLEQGAGPEAPPSRDGKVVIDGGRSVAVGGDITGDIRISDEARHQKPINHPDRDKNRHDERPTDEPVATLPSDPVDRDEDGLKDAWEAEFGLDPGVADTDADDLSDAYEASTGSEPNRDNPLERSGPETDDDRAAQPVRPAERGGPRGAASHSRRSLPNVSTGRSPRRQPQHDVTTVSVPAQADSMGSRSQQTSALVRTVSLDEAVRVALGVDVRLGALGIDAPPLKLGRNDLVKVVISRDLLAEGVVQQFVTASQIPSVEVLKTSAIMYVDLSGPAFDVKRLNPPGGEQLVADTAVWEFNVVPKASGMQTMTVSASMRIPIPEHGERTVGVPSLEMTFRVDVDRLYAGRSFVRNNWQWLGTSAIAAAAVVGGIIWH